MDCVAEASDVTLVKTPTKNDPPAAAAVQDSAAPLASTPKGYWPAEQLAPLAARATAVSASMTLSAAARVLLVRVSVVAAPMPPRLVRAVDATAAPVPPLATGSVPLTSVVKLMPPDGIRNASLPVVVAWKMCAGVRESEPPEVPRS